MDGVINPPPELFGVAPRGQSLQPDGHSAANSPIDVMVLPESVRGALLGALMEVPPVNRTQALSSVIGLISRAVKEHFVGFEEALAVPATVQCVQEIYLNQTLRALNSDNPTPEAVTSFVRAAYAKHRPAKDELLKIIAQSSQPSAQTRGPAQAESLAQKSALLVGLVSVLTLEEASPRYQEWSSLVEYALHVLRVVLHGVLGKMAHFGINALRDEVARVGQFARPAILAVIEAHFAGKPLAQADDLIHAIRTVLYGTDSSPRQQEGREHDRHVPDNEMPPQGRVQPEGPHQGNSPQPYQRPQVGNVPPENGSRHRGSPPLQHPPSVGQQGGQGFHHHNAAPLMDASMAPPHMAAPGRRVGAFGGFGG